MWCGRWHQRLHTPSHRGTRGQAWAPMLQSRHPLSGVLVCSVFDGWRLKRWCLGNKEGRSEEAERGPCSDHCGPPAPASVLGLFVAGAGGGSGLSHVSPQGFIPRGIEDGHPWGTPCGLAAQGCLVTAFLSENKAREKEEEHSSGQQ